MPRYPCLKTGKKDIYPSVTEIISDCTNSSGALTQWSANMCKLWIEENACPVIDDESWYVNLEDLDNMRFHFREVSQKALDIGSEVHDAIEWYLKYERIPTFKTEAAQNAFKAFHSWKEENKLQPLRLEQTVYGDNWAGTLDFLGYFNDKLYVIDWKSSKAHYPEMRYQVAAYRSESRVKKDIRGIVPVGNGVLRLDKETGMPDFKDHSKTYKKDLAVFNAMVKLYYLRHPRIAKKFKEAQDEIS